MFDKLLLCCFAIVLILIQNINAQELESCNYEAATVKATVTINDNHSNTKALNCPIDDTANIQDGKYDCNGFFSFTKKGSDFTFNVNEKYKDFEQNIFDGQKLDGITKYQISGNHFLMEGACKMKDKNNKALDVEVSYKIIDNNDHNPTFETKTTEYTIPIPLMPGYDITLNNPLYVNDIDLTTSEIIVNVDQVDGKDYFKTKNILNSSRTSFVIFNAIPWVENKTFELVLNAQDQDGMKSKESMKVDVTIDKDSSLDIPKFGNRIYQFAAKDGKINEKITYESKKKVGVTKFGPDKDSFAFDDDEKGTITLTSDKLPDKELITLGLTITSDYSDSCTVFVTSKVQDDLKFNNYFYLANYTLDNNFEMKEKIEVVASQNYDDIDVTIEDYKEYFEQTYKNKLVTINVQQGKNLHDLKLDLIEVPLKVQSKKASLSSISYLLVTVASKTDDDKLQFEKTIYTAKYNIKDDLEKATVTLDEDIKIIGLKNGQKVDMTIEADCEDCKFTVNQAEKITISVTKALSQDFLEKNRHLVVKIKATLTDDKTQFCEAAINMNLDEIKGPTFNNPLYKASYNTTEKKVMKSETILTTNVGSDKAIVSITDTEYKDFLTLEPQDKGWILKETNKPLVVENSLSVFVHLVAQENGYPKKSTATVVLSIVNENQIIEDKFKFTQPIYKATYKLENEDLKKASVELTDKISFEGLKKDQIVDIKIMESTFSVKNEGQEYLIEVDTPLDLETLEQNRKILFKMQASDPNANHCEAALELTLPELPGPKFTKTSFQAVYNISTKELEKTTEPITVDQVINKDNVDIKIDAKYQKSLNLERDGENYKLTLNKDNPIDVGNEKLIFIGMEITEKNRFTNKDNKATIVLRVVDDQTPKEKLVFVKSLHKIDYKVDKKTGQITITGDDIEMKNFMDPNEVTFKINSDYETSFSFKYDSASATWKIGQGADPLPLSKINDNPLVLTVVASEGSDNSAESALSVTLPEKKNNGNGDDDGDGDNTTLIAIVAVLAVLLVGYIVGTALFYVLKIRKQMQRDPDVEMEEYAKKRNLTQAKPPAGSVRRPTGMVFGRPIIDDDDDDDGNDQGESSGANSAEDKERRKSVVFNENVEEMKIDTTSINDNNGGDTASEKSIEKDD